MDVAERIQIVMNWADALEKVVSNDADKIPPGFKTRAELEKVFGFKTAHTNSSINKLLKAGLAENRIFKIKCGKFIRPTAHFKLKK